MCSIGALARMARDYAALPMLARTHGQPASPTTFGKEMANVGARLRRARARLAAVEILAKWNGAVGNYNAHQAARPEIDWIEVSRGFIQSQQLTWNAYSTQIEPHDWIAEYCDACAAANTILIDLCRDLWGYVALGYLRQSAVAGEVGSSTMPHKVNPIDFENAEGNVGLANAMLRFFADKLPISRWQRDLSDSTVLRNLGVALAHTLIGWKSLQRGLTKVSPDRERMTQELDGAYEVLAEAIQSVLRAARRAARLRAAARSHARRRASMPSDCGQLIDNAAAAARTARSASRHCGRQNMSDWPPSWRAPSRPTRSEIVGGGPMPADSLAVAQRASPTVTWLAILSRCCHYHPPVAIARDRIRLKRDKQGKPRPHDFDPSGELRARGRTRRADAQAGSADRAGA